MKIKKLIIGTCLALFSAVNMATMSVNATSVSFLVDNAPTASSGYQAVSSGFSYYTFSGSYNGDANRSPNINSNYYDWIHSPSTPLPVNLYGTTTVQLQVYLNHSTFDDRSAEYRYWKNGAFDSLPNFTVNQNSAPSQWSKTMTRVDTFSSAQSVSLHPGGGLGSYTGADAIQITYSY